MILKKTEITILDEEFKQIANINIGDKYGLKVEDDEYYYNFQFGKTKNYFEVYIEITDKLKIPITRAFFRGTLDIWSLFDKVFKLYFFKKDVQMLIKLSNGETFKQNFLGSIVVSNKINNIGGIYLYNHISYTDFNIEKEIIELCFKYSCFCEKILGKNPYITINKMLDKDLVNIKNFFQQKLDYYGYDSEQEVINTLKDMHKVEEKLRLNPKTKEEIKNKIIALTQYLLYVTEPSAIISITSEITVATENYTRFV